MFCCQSEQLRSEVEQLRHKQHVASEEIAALRIALEESRSNGERLHRESELVVQNVNTWVREQKQANEKLGNKIREQSKAIMALSSEKESVVTLITKRFFIQSFPFSAIFPSNWNWLLKKTNAWLPNWMKKDWTMINSG